MPFPEAMKAATNKSWMARLHKKKEPISVLTTPPEGVAVDPEKPNAWRWQWVEHGDKVRATFAEAAAVVLANKDVYAGLNFILHPGADRTIRPRLICLDFDGGIDPSTGEAWPEVEEIIAKLELFGDVFVETSQSGRGLHAFANIVCAPFTNVMQRAVNASCKVDVLCNSQVACTGKGYKGRLEITGEIPFTQLVAFPWFTEKESVSNATEFDFKQWWDQPDPGIPSGYEHARSNMLARTCIEGAGASNEMIHAARWLVHQGITGHLGVNLLRLIPSYGKREHGYPPYPWTEEELRHKMMQAYARAKNGGTLDKGVAALAGEFGEIAGGADKILSAEPWFIELSPDDIDRDYPTDDQTVIRDVLDARCVANIIASPKLGKSYFITQLIVCYVADIPWLGFKFGDAPRRVLLIDNELKPRRIRKRFRATAEALGVDFNLIRKSVRIVSLRGQHRKISAISAEMRRIPAGKYGIVCIDSYYRALEGNESDPEVMAKFFDHLTGIAEAQNAAVIGVHHTSKGNQSEKEKTDVGSGSSVISRAVDGHIILRKHEEAGCVVMEFELRDYACPDPVVLRREFPLWVVVPGADPTKLANGHSKPKPTEADVVKLLSQPTYSVVDRKDLQQSLVRNVGCTMRAAADLIKSLTADGILNRIDGPNNTYKVTLAAQEIDE